MRFAILFPLISAGLCLIAAEHGGWTWLLLWPALSFLLIGIAYALKTPKIFAKRPDGTLAWWSVLLLLPYHILNEIIFHTVRSFHRLHSSEPYASQISPTLWVSRRITRREVPPGITCIVDMTCEFPAPRGITNGGLLYRCLPTLDHASPQPQQARALVQELRTINGPILIHCAQGHGRSVMIAAALLITTHLAKDPDDAFQMIKRHRPNIRMSRSQRATLKAITKPNNSPS